MYIYRPPKAAPLFNLCKTLESAELAKVRVLVKMLQTA